MTEIAASDHSPAHDSATFYRQLAATYYAQGKFNEAIVACEQSLELEPNSAHACQVLGDALRLLGRLEAAREWCFKAINCQPDNAQAHHSLGDVLQDLWQLEAAASAYRRAIELDPQLWQSHYNLGQTLSKQGYVDEVIQCYCQSTQLNPNFSWSYHCLGEVLAGIGQLEAAAMNYRQAIVLNPTAYISHLYLGDVLERQQQFEEAVIHYQKSVELNPEHHLTHHHLGRALSQLGEFQAASVAYRQSIALNSEFCWSQHLLGEALIAQGEWSEAAACFRSAIALNPSFFGSYEKLGDALIGGRAYQNYSWMMDEIRLDGRLDQAIDCYRRAIRLNLNNFWSYLQLGQSLSVKGEIEEAIQNYQTACYQKTLRSNPSLLSAVWNLESPRSPDFLIIGAGKAGTSSLYEYLANHPQILPAVQKEIDFFSHCFEKGLSWYLAQFPPLIEDKNYLTGEATPSYLVYPDVPERLVSLFPNVKLIVLLRNPVSRAISHYHHNVAVALEERSLEEAMLSEIEFLKESTDASLTNNNHFEGSYGYISQSLYFYHLKRWMKLFPKEQFLILKSEDLYKNTSETVRKAFQFLELPDYPLEDYPNYYPGVSRSSSEDLKIQLTDYFRSHNEKLEKYLEVQFDWG